MHLQPGIARSEEVQRLMPWRKPPRLVLRFAFYTAFGLALAGASILLFVRHFERGRAERAATTHTQLVAELLSDRLRPSDFEQPVARARRAQLEALVARSVLRQGIVRLELIAPDGLVTFSTDRALIGKRDLDRVRVAAALAGTVVSHVKRLDPPGRAPELDVLRAYARVRVGQGPGGVIALSQDHAPIAAAARRAFVPVVSVLELVLLGLYVSLFPILRRVTRGLRRQMDVIEHQALHDALTGLPNRTLFQGQVAEALSADDGKNGLSILLVDLDRFKDVNDTLGHDNGDLLLREVGDRLSAIVGESDAVARLGGDEFGVVSRSATDAPRALALAERLRAAISAPLEIGGVSLEVQGSIGIALAPTHGSTVDVLLRRADVAMYAAKGAHAPQLYSAEHDDNSPGKLALVGELRGALDRGELVVYYQPQLDLRTRGVCGVEALVRWRHPSRGFLPPSAFLPVAEHAGLMRGVTRSVLEQALAQCRAWHNDGRRLDIAVNVSGRDLVDTRFADEVGRALAEHGVDPSSLHIEITEGTMLSDRARSSAVLAQLDDLGVRIVIDDFGTGYSSLGQLRQLPVDVLKIDKSFVTGMNGNASDAAIVRSTIDLAHSLGLRVVAEGVESESAAERLALLGCDMVQGFGISRPLSAADIAAWLAASDTVVRRVEDGGQVQKLRPSRPTAVRSAGL